MSGTDGRSTIDMDRPADRWPVVMLAHPAFGTRFDDEIAGFAAYLRGMMTPAGVRRPDPLRRAPLITLLDNAEALGASALVSNTPIRAELFRPIIGTIRDSILAQYIHRDGLPPGWWRPDGTPTPFRIENGEVVADAAGRPVSLCYPMTRVASCLMTEGSDEALRVAREIERAIGSITRTRVNDDGAAALMAPHAMRPAAGGRGGVEACWVGQGGNVLSDPFDERYENRVPWFDWRTKRPRAMSIPELDGLERVLGTRNADGGWPKDWDRRRVEAAGERSVGLTAEAQRAQSGGEG